MERFKVRGRAGRMAALSCLLAFSAAIAGVAGVAAQSPAYRLVKKVPLGGVESWDYSGVDVTTHRIFVPRHSHTQVLDSDGKTVGDIPGAGWVHAVAFAPDLGRGFLSDGYSSMTIFDLASLKILQTVPIPNRWPDDLIYDPATRRVFLFNAPADMVTAPPGDPKPTAPGGNDVTAVDATTGKIAGSLQLDDKLEGGQTDAAGHIFVELEEKSQVVEFDARTLKVLARWPTAPCDSPRGQLAIDTTRHRLFFGCRNKVMVMMSTDTGKVVATAPIGAGTDVTKFDPGTGLVFVPAGGDAIITVVHEDSPDKLTVVQTLQTEARATGAGRMTVDAGNHNIYLMTGKAAAPRTPENPTVHLPNTSTLWIFTRQ
jgi:hypothetical protein